MTTININEERKGQVMEGQYRVESSCDYWCPVLKSNVCMVRLTDHASKFTVMYQGEEPFHHAFHSGNYLDVKIWLPESSGWVEAQLLSCSQLFVTGLNSPSALFTYDACPEIARSALDEFVTMIATFKALPLKRFVLSTLCSTEMRRGFLQSPGSKRHHHAYPGGLLVHTVGAMQKGRVLAEMVYSRHPDWVELCMVFAFLHDLGKIVTQGRYIDLGLKGLTHDEVTPYLVQDSLAQLRQEWVWAAERVDEMLRRYAKPNKADRKWLDHKGVELSHWADALDVMAWRQDMLDQALGTEAANDDRFEAPEEVGLHEEQASGWFSEDAPEKKSKSKPGWFKDDPISKMRDHEAYLNRVNTADFGPNWEEELRGYV